MFLTPTTFICRNKNNTVKHDSHKCNHSENCQQMKTYTNGWITAELEYGIVKRACKNDIHTWQWKDKFQLSLSFSLSLSKCPTWCTISCFIISLLYSSTCLSTAVLIIRRSNCINTASGIVTLCRWPSGCFCCWCSQPRAKAAVALQPLGLLYALFSRSSHCRRQMSSRPTRHERSEQREVELNGRERVAENFA
jgi:hypothetical protein